MDLNCTSLTGMFMFIKNHQKVMEINNLGQTIGKLYRRISCMFMSKQSKLNYRKNLSSLKIQDVLLKQFDLILNFALCCLLES